MVYLSNTPIEELLIGFMDALKGYSFNKTETIPVDSCLDRVLAENIFSPRSVPHYHSSAMDGYQVKAMDTKCAHLDNPILLSWNQVKYVDTGDPILPEYDSVIKIEDVHKKEEGIEIISAIPKWQHVRPIGEDITAHDLLLTTGKILKPMDVAALIASGVRTVKVFCNPRVGIIPTGDEIVPWTIEPKDGQIVDSNSHLFFSMIKKWGGEPTIYPITPDALESLEEIVEQAVAENDLVLINAGSSAGSEDYTSKVIASLGEVIYHGVAIKPGKPAVFGRINSKPVIGIPGYPVSGYVVMEILVKEIYFNLKGGKISKRKVVRGKLSKPVISDLKFKEYVRVKVGKVNGQYIASPMSRGAALMSTVLHGDGFLVIPQSSEGYQAGEVVEIQLFEEKDYDNTFVSIGSHDMALDILASYLAPKYDLSSAHVGSLGGILAVKKGEAHFAGVHLLNPFTGEYNISYINKYLKGTGVVLVNLVKRTQGLMVEKGNPKNIFNIKDLVGKTIANRQKGAGTRILLDYLLNREKIQAQEIQGYEREFFTHLAVASEVKSKRADAAMGIYAAAKAMELDFIPLYEENYDLLITKEFYDSPGFKYILEIIISSEFRKEVEELGGYNLEETGKVIYLEGK